MITQCKVCGGKATLRSEEIVSSTSAEPITVFSWWEHDDYNMRDDHSVEPYEED